MLFGHVETLADRVDHLRQLRKLQDETHGFVGFVPLPYQPENNENSGAVSADRFRYVAHDCGQPDLPRQF